MNIKLAIKKKFSPKHRQGQIDVVTKLTTGKAVKELAEEALEVATDGLTTAEEQLAEKKEEHDKAEVALESANISKKLRKSDFDTVAEILE